MNCKLVGFVPPGAVDVGRDAVFVVPRGTRHTGDADADIDRPRREI